MRERPHRHLHGGGHQHQVVDARAKPLHRLWVYGPNLSVGMQGLQREHAHGHHVVHVHLEPHQRDVSEGVRHQRRQTPDECFAARAHHQDGGGDAGQSRLVGNLLYQNEIHEVINLNHLLGFSLLAHVAQILQVVEVLGLGVVRQPARISDGILYSVHLLSCKLLACFGGNQNGSLRSTRAGVHVNCHQLELPFFQLIHNGCNEAGVLRKGEGDGCVFDVGFGLHHNLLVDFLHRSCLRCSAGKTESAADRTRA
mmetsp:Transcript_22598/g.43148  ORF Transcript_22598/g.43148 Transcript_22598/m.43148 type:complete len:254 (+) Transcript_22598:2166-2927(+)